MKLTLYRFTGPYDYCKPYTMTFETDKEAFEDTEGVTDGPEMVGVEKWDNGWFYWDWKSESWIYNPQAPSEQVPHVRPDGSIQWPKGKIPEGV